MEFVYHAEIIEDPDGGWLVTFPDVPEAITHGADWPDALRSGSEALGLALRGYLAEDRDLPQPATSTGTPISVDAEDALKLAVISAFKSSGISKTELARRLGKRETEARRILDPDHGTKLGLIQDALRVLGKQIVVTIREAA
jgi:antitoxin HicB